MRYYLAITTSVLAFTSASLVRAQDCAITDCSALGYTESSNQGNCLKCPFGNAWACPNVKPEWGKCNGSAKNCNIGDILYSDGTCSAQNISGKTPIAVVVYKSADGNCAQAMALNSVDTAPGGGYSVSSMPWGGYGTDIPGLKNITSDSSASTDFKSCKNTAIITAAGDKITYPAAWAAKIYNTTGTEPGDWCLPAAGIMTSIKNNMSAINNGLNLAGGAQIGTSSYFWSSSEDYSYYAWYSDFSRAYGLGNNGSGHHKNYSSEVRPVLEF